MKNWYFSRLICVYQLVQSWAFVVYDEATSLQDKLLLSIALHTAAPYMWCVDTDISGDFCAFVCLCSGLIMGKKNECYVMMPDSSQI